MTLERFVFASFVAALLILFLTGCSGDSESLLEPDADRMDYVIEGRAILQTNPTAGVGDIRIMAYGPTDVGSDDVIKSTTTDADGYYRLRFRGQADYCPIVNRDIHTRGYRIVVSDNIGTLVSDDFTAQCGVSPQTWNFRMSEYEHDGGCLFVCAPYL